MEAGALSIFALNGYSARMLNSKVRMTLLGTGTSTGVPIIGCDCAVCRSPDPRDQHLRCSAWVETKGKSIIIDTATDFRQQALRHSIPKVDAVLYTHPHADHIQGIDELRSFNFSQKGRIPVFGNTWTESDLKSRFQYIFSPRKVEGGGIPLLDFHLLNPEDEILHSVRTETGVEVMPIDALHGSAPVLGFRFGSIAYLTDCSYIPVKSLERLKGLEILVLDCVRLTPHGTHLNFDQALEVVEQVRPKRTILTHLGHDFGFVEWSRKLPPGVELGTDGLVLETGN